MKKIVLFFAAALIAVGVSAQEKAITFGVRGGINLSNVTVKGDGNSSDDLKSKIGFNVGVTADYALSSNLFLMSGLEYTTKGTKYDEVEYVENTKVNVTATVNIGYLQMPIHIGYKIPVSEGVKVVLRGGPYLAYATNGTVKVTGKAMGVEVSESTNLFSKDSDTKRFDMGLGLAAGAEFGKIGVTLGYDLGLTSIEKGEETTKNQNAYLSVGYKF